jgi:hypothetical protein
MTGQLSLDAEAIRTDARKVEGVTFPPPSATVSPPCALAPAKSAAEAFNRAARDLGADQKHLADIKIQIVDTLNRAATAYELTDFLAAGAINGDGASPAGIPQMTAPPSAFPVSNTIGDAAGGDLLNGVCFADDGTDTYMDIESAQAAITAPDDCASLLIAMDAWTTNAGALAQAAATMPSAPSHWEGTAAAQAYARVADLKRDLSTLAEAWLILAGRANGFAMAHHSYMTSHTEVYAAYKQNQLLLNEYPANYQEYHKAMAEEVKVAEEIRRQYSKSSELPKGPIPGPSGRALPSAAGIPTPGITPVSWPTGASNAGGGNSSPANGSGGGAPSSGTGSQQGGGSPAEGMQDTGEAQTRPQGAPQGSPQGNSPQGNEAKQAGQPPSGGMPSGGSPSGGIPAGGGTPGGMSGGMPDSGKTGSKPFSPSVHPASAGGAGKGLGGAGKGAGGAGKGAGGGGKGAGGAGKGAGGGMGGRPLSPAAVAVGPPTGAGGAGAGPGTVDTGRAPTGAGAGGAGMPMMGHGAGHTQGKEKKRSAELSPDESLYAEDRPWTEGVVGHRRREIQGDSGANKGTRNTQ